jgi:hypothetical protein
LPAAARSRPPKRSATPTPTHSRSLVEKSLLCFSEGRFWMLETIREYTAEQVAASRERELYRNRHLESVAVETHAGV